MNTEKIAFRMFLNPGQVAEYKHRHDTIWPELKALLQQSGIRDYSIFLDEERHVLFATLRRTADHTMDDLPRHPVMKRWWEHMADLMEVEPGNRPREWPLRPMFYFA